jgi:hypothetical protein
MAFAAYEEYVQYGVTLSRHEATIVRKLTNGEAVLWEDFAYFGERTITSEGKPSSVLQSRRRELAEKLDLEIPVSGVRGVA